MSRAIPSHSEHDRVVAEANGTELDGLCVPCEPIFSWTGDKSRGDLAGA